jgi:hypothetical protein
VIFRLGVSRLFATYRGTYGFTGTGDRNAFNEYAAVYFNDVQGDFDVMGKMLSQAPLTGNYSAIGLILRNEMSDIQSGGVTTHYRVPKYGGYKIWHWDSDGDGLVDYRSDGGHSQLPVWFKLEKRGKSVRAYSSLDGTTWRPNGKPHALVLQDSTIADVQDVGVFGTAWSDNGEIVRIEFSNLELIPRTANPSDR